MTDITKNRQERYKDVFCNEGVPEYVINYVLGEIYTDERTKEAEWQEGDLMSCIMSAYARTGDFPPGMTISEATSVAEWALEYISKAFSRKICATQYPTDGWRFDDELGYQVEISN